MHQLPSPYSITLCLHTPAVTDLQKLPEKKIKRKTKYEKKGQEKWKSVKKES